MLEFMLDTSICIYVIKSRPAALRERFDQLAEALCISTVTLAELLHGVEKSARRGQNFQAVEQFGARLEVLPFSAKAAAHFGQIRAELARAGRPCGAYDMLIAAHARSESLMLVTNNAREFRRMPGLRVDDWIWKPTSTEAEPAPYAAVDSWDLDNEGLQDLLITDHRHHSDVPLLLPFLTKLKPAAVSNPGEIRTHSSLMPTRVNPNEERRNLPLCRNHRCRRYTPYGQARARNVRRLNILSRWRRRLRLPQRPNHQ